MIPMERESAVSSVCSSDIDSSSQEAPSTSKPSSTTLPCLWKDCEEVCDDAMAFWTHLQCHAIENMAGPCLWEQCPNGGPTGVSRASRHQSRFMEHHITTHFPKNAFRCFLEGCNKAFDTPEKLNGHLSKHPQPKKNERPEFKLEDPNDGRVREAPMSTINIAGGLENLQRICAAHDVLRSVGICYVAVHRDYFVTLHGIPAGDWKSCANGYEQTYRLHYPYFPDWTRQLSITCQLESAQNRNSVITWKLPLSNPVFRDQLRHFVKEAEKRFAK
ncbi:hypothetical protein RvY_07973 [Ramazzottius varieornatus]|uniref:C2H2-type domain-containing protein n=1 Tax=Ramazzottius varieornatus TaxID=947166 RepID=A0A1D1VCD2_RAMVA|nr:hypothetical protein RvY_07973 [Ramazzottius varieornatus]